MESAAGWIAPIATMLAAVLTASNLGARVTGSGFIVFTIGSLAWCAVALATHQSNLLWTNGFLVLVNILGVWRWLGRQARFEQGGRAAEAEGRRPDVPEVSPMSGLVGLPVSGAGDAVLGRVVDAVIDRGDLTLSYLVVTNGGLAGLGETLYGISAHEVWLQDARLAMRPGSTPLDEREPLAADDWPARLLPAHLGHPD